MTNGAGLQQFYPQITNSPSGKCCTAANRSPNPNLHGRLKLCVQKVYGRRHTSVTLTVFCYLLTWNQQISTPETLMVCQEFPLFNIKNIPGICVGIMGADAFNRSSMDPWTEFWSAQDDWGTRCKPRTPESEYSWAVRWAWPGFLMMGKPQSRSICCQRWRCSRRQAVISDKAFLWKTPSTF